jgi:hypothetical protein
MMAALTRAAWIQLTPRSSRLLTTFHTKLTVS